MQGVLVTEIVFPQSRLKGGAAIELCIMEVLVISPGDWMHLSFAAAAAAEIQRH